MKDIYDDLDVSSNLALFLFQPSSIAEEIRDENWVQAMDEEIEATVRNDTWDLVDFRTDKNLIGVKRVYKKKLNEEAEIDRFKARLVEKGLLQQLGIDIGETFALVARLDTTRVILAKIAHNNWKIYKRDAKLASLNGILEEEIYV